MREKNKSDIRRKHHPIGNMLLRARYAWLGPANIKWGDPKSPFFGWPILYLEAKDISRNLINTRIAYGHLYAEDHINGVLRAVYWNGEHEKKKARAKSSDYIPSVAARFVKIDRTQIEEWLSQLNGLRYVVDTDYRHDEDIVVRRMRVEMDYASSAFEFIWESNTKPFNELNECWKLLWSSMGQALEDNPVISNFNEDFWAYEPSFEYRLSKYPIDQ